MSIDIREVNSETLDVSLWIANNERFYKLSLYCKDYGEFVDILHKRGEYHTPGGVLWADPNVNVKEVNELEFNER